MRTLLTMALVCLGVVPTLSAQEPVVTAPDASRSEPASEGGPPKTLPADLEFGQRPVPPQLRFVDSSKNIGRVDRRDDIDAASGRAILLSTANTPEAGTVSFSNHMLVLTQASFSPTDDLQLTASLVAPIDVADLHLGFAGKITLNEGDSHIFSIQPFTQYRRGRGDLPSSDFGLGVAALLDLFTSNNLVTTLGVFAYGNLFAGTGEFSYENCQSRSDFIDGSCRETRTATEFLPAGGHFIGAQFALTWYIFDQWSLRGEAMTGIAAGSVMGSEWVTRTVDPVDSSERLRTGPAQGGIPYGSDYTVGLGLQWSNGLFAVQFSGYALQAPAEFPLNAGDQNIFFTPMFNFGVTL